MEAIQHISDLALCDPEPFVNRDVISLRVCALSALSMKLMVRLIMSPFHVQIPACCRFIDTCGKLLFATNLIVSL